VAVQARIHECQRGMSGDMALEAVIKTVKSACQELSILIDRFISAKDGMQSISKDLGELDDDGDSTQEKPKVHEAQHTIESKIIPAIVRLETAINILKKSAQDVARVVDIEEQPMATISITEDLATSVRLHALGWKSIFHPEVLARGLAPEDLESTIRQRSRWAQGTLQVLTKDNPLFKAGLSFMQRLQYFTTMFSYFYGFAALIYLISPIVPLMTGITPVNAYSQNFFIRLLPYLVLNQLLFAYATRGLSTIRGQHYQLALFPVWIGAFIKVLLGEELSFEVTPKTRQQGINLRIIKPQLLIICFTLTAIGVGTATLSTGTATDPISIVVNMIWAFYNLWMLSSILLGAFWKPVHGGQSLDEASSAIQVASYPVKGEIPDGRQIRAFDN
jgi:hypothetical protein